MWAEENTRDSIFAAMQPPPYEIPNNTDPEPGQWSLFTLLQFHFPSGVLKSGFLSASENRKMVELFFCLRVFVSYRVAVGVKYAGVWNLDLFWSPSEGEKGSDFLPLTSWLVV